MLKHLFITLAIITVTARSAAHATENKNDTEALNLNTFNGIITRDDQHGYFNYTPAGRRMTYIPHRFLEVENLQGNNITSFVPLGAAVTLTVDCFSITDCHQCAVSGCGYNSGRCWGEYRQIEFGVLMDRAMKCHDSLNVCDQWSDSNRVAMHNTKGHEYQVVKQANDFNLGYSRSNNQSIPSGYFCTYDIHQFVDPGYSLKDYKLNIAGDMLYLQDQLVVLQLITATNNSFYYDIDAINRGSNTTGLQVPAKNFTGAFPVGPDILQIKVLIINAKTSFPSKDFMLNFKYITKLQFQEEFDIDINWWYFVRKMIFCALLVLCFFWATGLFEYPKYEGGEREDHFRMSQ